MRKNSFILIILILAPVMNAGAWNNLRIIDPMNPWQDYPSKISEVALTIHPRGTYMEVGMYMTFSAIELELDSLTQLEAIYNFELPSNAMVTDSWLWIEDKPEKALILDRWTASAIYEGIVERRRDPSILTKTGPTTYELRVYPLTGNMPRKVKINYLVPANWTSSLVTVPVPIGQLEVGWEHPEEVYVYTQTDDTWKNPTIISDSISELLPYSGEEYPANFRAAVSLDDPDCNLGFTSPMEDGLFINQYPVDNSGYYQLALLPSAQLDIEEPKKICFLMDYQGSQGDISGMLETTMRDIMQDTDSFNILVSGIEIRKASENWMPANDSIIKEAFDSLEDLTNSYSVLPMLIAEGIKFTGNTGALLILSDNYEVSSSEEANQLIEDLGDYKPWPVIHILDMNYFNHQVWMGGRNYYGNEYLYSLLSRQTNGNYLSLRNGKGLSQNLIELMQSASGFISSFDLYTTLDQGFCFSRFNEGLTGSTAYLNKTILQTGRYNGSFPFKLILSGVYNDKSFSEEISVDAEKIITSDTVSKQFWSGMYIRSLEQSPATNEIVGEIINESLENRVLTYYTAFLTLEPGMEPELPEEGEIDDNIAIGIDDDIPGYTELSLSGYPNPFTSEITFELEIPNEQLDHNANLQIYNVSGQLVSILHLGEYHKEGSVIITWDGRDGSGNEIEQGIYIVKYLSKHTSKTIRIVKISS